MPLGGDVEIPLVLQTSGLEGHFSIQIPYGQEASTETYSLPADWSASLVDTRGTADPSDDVTHPLTPGGEAYTFEVTAAEAQANAMVADSVQQAAATTDALVPPRLERMTWSPPQSQVTTNTDGSDSPPATRFLLRVETGQPLPVELAAFNAVRDGERIQLEWQTASETNNAGFHIEHQSLALGDTTAMPDAETWTTLGFVEGTGTTTEPHTYRFRTSDLEYGRHVFRLRQVDTDGTETTTEPVEVVVRLDKAYAVGPPYPNPVRQRATLPITVREKQPVRVELYDLLGRRVSVPFDREVRAQTTERIRLNTRRLASGSYFVRIRGKNFAATRRLTVVR